MKKIYKNSNVKRLTQGFTIIELVVVIIIIGILTTIGTLSYSGIQKKAVETSLLSDIDAMEAAQTNYGLINKLGGKAYHSTTYDSDLEFQPGSGNIIDVIADGVDYCIKGYNTQATKNSINNSYIRETSSGACNRIALTQEMAQKHFIKVPGSATYGTSDFYVMKYEASCLGCNAVAVSQTDGNPPWDSATRADAILYSTNACSSGCHLITEAEWLTIAQNVLSVPSNWSGNAVGSGYIYSGNNDGGTSYYPGNYPRASANDNDGYYLTGNFAGDNSITNGMIGNSQRRTLTLTNGEVIWDFAGNVVERTSDLNTGGQPGVSGGGYAYREWTAITIPGTLPQNPSPTATGIAGANLWNSSKGIGKIYSSSDDSASGGWYRGGGNSSTPGLAGVLAMTRIGTGGYVGFRTAR